MRTFAAELLRKQAAEQSAISGHGLLSFQVCGKIGPAVTVIPLQLSINRYGSENLRPFSSLNSSEVNGLPEFPGASDRIDSVFELA